MMLDNKNSQKWPLTGKRKASVKGHFFMLFRLHINKMPDAANAPTKIHQHYNYTIVYARCQYKLITRADKHLKIDVMHKIKLK